jgi:hypothetical protein
MLKTVLAFQNKTHALFTSSLFFIVQHSCSFLLCKKVKMKTVPQKTPASTRKRQPTWKKRELDDFIPVLLEPIPVESEALLEDPIPHFNPSSRVSFKPMRCLLSVDDPLSLFLALFGEESL